MCGTCECYSFGLLSSFMLQPLPLWSCERKSCRWSTLNWCATNKAQQTLDSFHSLTKSRIVKALGRRLVCLRVWLCPTIVECSKMAVRFQWNLFYSLVKGNCERSLKVKWIADRIQVGCACSGLSIRLRGSISMSGKYAGSFQCEQRWIYGAIGVRKVQSESFEAFSYVLNETVTFELAICQLWSSIVDVLDSMFRGKPNEPDFTIENYSKLFESSTTNSNQFGT